MRDLTEDFIEQLTASMNRPCSFLEWTLASSTVRLWSGSRDISWNGQTWLGNGWYRGVASIREVGDIEAVGVTVDMNGVPESLISTLLSDARQGYPVSIYFGFLDDSGAVIADPADAYIGRFDTAEIADDVASPSITLSLESVLIDLDKSKELLLTNEAQKSLFPGDTGFQYVGTLQDAKFYWGNKKADMKKKKRRVKR